MGSTLTYLSLSPSRPDVQADVRQPRTGKSYEIRWKDEPAGAVSSLDRRLGFGPGAAEEPQWVFILGTGRSGSTTVLTMVNQIAPLTMQLAGENNNLVERYMDTYKAWHQKRGLGKVGEGSWWRLDRTDPLNLLDHPKYSTSDARERDKEAMLAGFRQLLSATTGQYTQIRGYKEVRVLSLDLLRFYRELFPGAKFILNWRNDLDAQKKSRNIAFCKKCEKEQQHQEDLPRINKIFKSFAYHNPNVTFKLPLEKFSVERYNDLITFLGFEGCEFNRVVKTNTLKPGEKKDLLESVIDGECVPVAPKTKQKKMLKKAGRRRAST